MWPTILEGCLAPADFGNSFFCSFSSTAGDALITWKKACLPASATHPNSILHRCKFALFYNLLPCILIVSSWNNSSESSGSRTTQSWILVHFRSVHTYILGAGCAFGVESYRGQLDAPVPPDLERWVQSKDWKHFPEGCWRCTEGSSS